MRTENFYKIILSAILKVFPKIEDTHIFKNIEELKEFVFLHNQRMKQKYLHAKTTPVDEQRLQSIEFK